MDYCVELNSGIWITCRNESLSKNLASHPYDVRLNTHLYSEPELHPFLPSMECADIKR